MARKQNTEAPVADATDTAKSAESTATPAPTDTSTETVTTPSAPEVPTEPVAPPADPEVPHDPLEHFKSITPEGITMYNFR